MIFQWEDLTGVWADLSKIDRYRGNGKLRKDVKVHSPITNIGTSEAKIGRAFGGEKAIGGEFT